MIRIGLPKFPRRRFTEIARSAPAVFLFGLALLVPSVTTSLPAFAIGLNQKVALETTLENKLKPVLNAVDPSAYVRVTLNLKQERWNLPAAGVEAQLPLVSEKATYSPEETEIQDVEVTVYSRIDPVPENLKSLVSESLSAALDTKSKKARIKIDFKTYEPQISRLMDIRQFGSPGGIGDNPALRNAVIAICAVLLLGAALISTVFWIAFRNPPPSARREGRHYDEEDSDRSARAKPEPSRADYTASDRRENPASSTPARSEKDLLFSLHEAPAGLVSRVLKDCWLTQNSQSSTISSYAKWLWQNLTLKQRQEVIATWPESAAYIEKLRGVPAVCDQRHPFHEDPFYLLPATDHPQLERRSSELLPLLKKNPELWKSLSPLRRQYSGLTLKERVLLLELANEEPENFDLSIRELTDADELYVTERPEIFRYLTPELHPSWLWAWRLSEDALREALKSVSARQIAAAWVGSPKLLQRIESALTKIKMDRVLELTVNASPSRDSDALISISIALEKERKRQESGAVKESKEKAA